MTSSVETIYAELKELRSQAEQEKITRRLPADSGLEAVGVRMKEVFDTAKARTDLPLAEVPVLLTSRWWSAWSPSPSWTSNPGNGV